jgi:hypothetical protein
MDQIPDEAFEVPYTNPLGFKERLEVPMPISEWSPRPIDLNTPPAPAEPAKKEMVGDLFAFSMLKSSMLWEVVDSAWASDPFRRGEILMLRMRLLEDPETEIICDVGKLDWIGIKDMPHLDLGGGPIAHAVREWRPLQKPAA